MLTGPEIARQVVLGAIRIDGFDPERVGPNSYDLTLGDKLAVYRKAYPLLEWAEGRRSGTPPAVEPLDSLQPEPVVELVIPHGGLVLYPGILYLGATTEYTETHGFVPCIDGRSSFGRLGLAVHVTAGFGDDGFAAPSWTLEMTVIHPLRIYAGTRICQINYTRVEGERKPYRGKYAGQEGPQASKAYEDKD